VKETTNIHLASAQEAGNKIYVHGLTLAVKRQFEEAMIEMEKALNKDSYAYFIKRDISIIADIKGNAIKPEGKLNPAYSSTLKFSTTENGGILA